ncbi:MAG: bleomycin resistance protein [Alphaproteobacteria bacterium]|nr:bleomycin resistance protein [Alphaproteobacteria bacterium]
MPLGGINHVAFSVRDLAASSAFYDPVMAFLGYERWPAVIGQAKWKKPGVGVFLLYECKPGSRDKVHDRYAPGLHHMSFDAESREQVDGLHRLLVERGATILDPPAPYTYTREYYAVFFADPDGLKLELAYTPHAYSR